MLKSSLVLVATGALAAACASYPAPNDHLATSMASLRAAQEVGAKGQPAQAALHVRLAQEGVDRAKKLMADGDNERADYAAMRANADAQLAIMLTREEEAKAKANQALAKVQEVSAQTTVTSATMPSAPASTMTTTTGPTPPAAPSALPPTTTTPSATPTPSTKSPR